MAFSSAALRNLRRLSHFRSSTACRIRRNFPLSAATRVSPFSACDNYQTVFFHVFVGMCSASFWRGSWYIFDDLLFPNQKELSAVSSLLLGTSGMVLVQGCIRRMERLTVGMYHYFRLSLRQARTLHSVLRFGAIYSLVLSVVCIWRGTWMSWDLLYAKYFNIQRVADIAQALHEHDGERSEPEATAIHASDPGHALQSGLLSHCGAVIALCALGIFSSVFAPPAAVSIIRDRTVLSSARTPIQRLLYRKVRSKQVLCRLRMHENKSSRHRVSN